MSSFNNKKILIVAESIDVEDSSGSKGRVALIRNLKKAGFILKVLHYTRKEIQIEGIECVSIKEKRRSLLFFLSRTERYLRYHLGLKLNKPLEKVFGFSFTLFNDRNSIIEALKAEINFKSDLVLTLSKGGSFRPHQALLNLPELHHKWIAYIHDPYPMHWYPPPYPWNEPGYRVKEIFMKKVADSCFKAAFPSQLLLEWMGDKYEPFRKKGVVLPHQIDDDQNELGNSSEFQLDPNKFNILHAGNLIQGREPYGLIKAYLLFLKKNKKAENLSELIFIGGHNYYSDYLNRKAQENKQFKWTREKLDFDSVQYLQQKASVNIILEAKSEISPFLPGKFPHCVIANKKILLLGPPKSESRRLLGENYQYWAEIDDVDKIYLHLETLFEVWQKNKKGLKLNREDLEFYLSSKNLFNTMKSISDSKFKDSSEHE